MRRQICAIVLLPWQLSVQALCRDGLCLPKRKLTEADEAKAGRDLSSFGLSPPAATGPKAQMDETANIQEALRPGTAPVEQALGVSLSACH
jgi:hypothetical protein